jgi:hypothetical protein
MNTDTGSWAAHLPAKERSLSPRKYGTIGIFGVGVFLLANAALHLLDPDLSVIDTVINDYALGDYGWISGTHHHRGRGTILLAGTADGLSQRVLALVMLTWWLVLATNLRRSATIFPVTEQSACI